MTEKDVVFGPDTLIEPHPETVLVLREMQAEARRQEGALLAEARVLEEVGNYGGAARCYVSFADHENGVLLFGSQQVIRRGERFGNPAQCACRHDAADGDACADSRRHVRR